MPTTKKVNRIERSLRGHALRAACLVALLSAPALADEAPEDAPRALGSFDLSGPRFGVTYLSPGVVDKLAEPDIDIHVGNAVTQFGWQFEKQFFDNGKGPTAVSEWVLLVGGLEHGTLLPSASWLMGIRTRGGTEFGVGPNITPLGVALTVAAGVTYRTGSLNLPINVAMVSSKAGPRFSLLCGFTFRRK